MGLITKRINNHHRIFLGILIAFSWAIFVASRMTMQDPSDDFTNYYANYQDLCNGNYGALFEYAKGLELGVPLLFLLLSFISKELSPNLLIFYITLISALLLLIWMEGNLFELMDNKLKGIAGAYVWVMASFFMASQSVRQYLAMIILLYAISSNDKLKKLLILFLASTFHLIAIPIYLIVEGIKKYKWKATISALIVILIFYFLYDIIYVTFGDNFPILNKLEYYHNNTDGFTEVDLNFLKIFSVPLLFLLYRILLDRHLIILNDPLAIIYLSFYLFYIAMFPFPLLSIRFTLIINSIILGLFCFSFLKNYVQHLIFLLIFLIIPWRIRSIVNIDPNNSMAYWSIYPQSSIYPVYYYIKMLNNY
ncbi:EpsG family protein [Polynucleobacter asymbioticus]|uniref:EpsG family protein n=1 Tax=Polynucleobacter asymbioticus TaxID=576611 RepID=UPI00210CCC24|nr:EpsG family protein [Polynucleobacter asymbioticus]